MSYLQISGIVKCISLGVVFVVAVFAGTIWQSKVMRQWVFDQTLPWRYGMQRQRNLMIPMRDGIRLATHVFKPAFMEGPFATVLIRTTYGGVSFKWPKLFVKNGFAVVVQNVRGRYGSEGSYSPHRYSRSDGYDTIDWIVKQKWSSDKVGTFGCSYLGESQSILAAEKHPNHIAMITDGGGGAIGSAMGSYGYFGLYENGVLNLASALGWYTGHGAINQTDAQLPDNYTERLKQYIKKLPVVSLARQVVPYETGFDDLVSHSLTDDWWRAEGYVSNTDTFATAGLHLNTWFDQTVHDTFRLAWLMEQNAIHPRARNQHVLIGPGSHCTSGKINTGKIKVGDLLLDYQDIDYEGIYLNWFNYWLKESPAELPSKFQYYLLRSSKWATAENWPPKKITPIQFFLAPSRESDIKKGTLQRNAPSDMAAYSFIYDPNNPAPTLGGSICCTELEDEATGPLDQRSIEGRPDILIYRSAILENDLDLVGNVRAVLYVSTSAPDTDFTVKLIDIFPDGKVLGLQDGIVRLRYRAGIENPKLAEPDKVYDVEVVLRPIAYRFRTGHRIAIHISSSNFPRLARNLNTGEHEYRGTIMQKAVNKVYHGPLHPSFIELQIIK